MVQFVRTSKAPRKTPDAAGSQVDLVLGPLPPQRVLDRHLPTGVALYGYNADDMRAYATEQVAAERELWQRIATNAQAVTTGCEDKLDYFEVPSHLMAALALALDEGPNA